MHLLLPSLKSTVLQEQVQTNRHILRTTHLVFSSCFDSEFLFFGEPDVLRLLLGRKNDWFCSPMTFSSSLLFHLPLPPKKSPYSHSLCLAVISFFYPLHVLYGSTWYVTAGCVIARVGEMQGKERVHGSIFVQQQPASEPFDKRHLLLTRLNEMFAQQQQIRLAGSFVSFEETCWLNTIFFHSFEGILRTRYVVSVLKENDWCFLRLNARTYNHNGWSSFLIMKQQRRETRARPERFHSSAFVAKYLKTRRPRLFVLFPPFPILKKRRRGKRNHSHCNISNNKRRGMWGRKLIA